MRPFAVIRSFSQGQLRPRVPLSSTVQIRNLRHHARLLSTLPEQELKTGKPETEHGPESGPEPQARGDEKKESQSSVSPVTPKKPIEIDDLGSGAFIKVHDQGLHLHKLSFWRSFFQLRDLCHCPICKDPHSKQRNFRTSEIHPRVRPQKVEFDGKVLRIKWLDDHVSEWSFKFVSKPAPALGLPPVFTWNRGTLEKNNPTWISFDDYISDDSKFAVAMRDLHQLGFVFVKDIPDSREMVEKIAVRMGPLRDTFYGKTWDVRTVPQAKNVAYTSQFLNFHMDLMYMNEPPGYQLLHCLENSCDGGESLFTDTFNVHGIMKQKYPQQYETLSKLSLNYEYNHDNHKYFQRRPVFEMNPNQLQAKKAPDLMYVNYSPPFQGALPRDWRREPTEETSALKLFESLMESHKSTFELKLKPGECVIFNNRRIAHARKQFNTATGSRWLAGAYVDTDALRSCFAVSQANHSRIWYDNRVRAYRAEKKKRT